MKKMKKMRTEKLVLEEKVRSLTYDNEELTKNIKELAERNEKLRTNNRLLSSKKEALEDEKNDWSREKRNLKKEMMDKEKRMNRYKRQRDRLREAQTEGQTVNETEKCDYCSQYLDKKDHRGRSFQDCNHIVGVACIVYGKCPCCINSRLRGIQI